MVEKVLETNASHDGAQKYWFNGAIVYRCAWSPLSLPDVEPKSVANSKPMILSSKRSPRCHGSVVAFDTRILSFPKFWDSCVFRNYQSVSKQVSRTVPFPIYNGMYMKMKIIINMRPHKC